MDGGDSTINEKHDDLVGRFGAAVWPTSAMG